MRNPRALNHDTCTTYMTFLRMYYMYYMDMHTRSKLTAVAAATDILVAGHDLIEQLLVDSERGDSRQQPAVTQHTLLDVEP